MRHLVRTLALMGIAASLARSNDADACTPPPPPPDGGIDMTPSLARIVEPDGGTVPTNVVVRVTYAHANIQVPFTPEITARVVGGGSLPATATLARSWNDYNPFATPALRATFDLWEVRVQGVPAGATFELLDRYDAPCKPCSEGEPAAFATFTAGAGPDLIPPVLDGDSGHIMSDVIGYQESTNTCTGTVCKGHSANWSWGPASDDQGAVFYQITKGDQVIDLWSTQASRNGVRVCQDCGQYGPSIYWNRFKLEQGLTVRAVDLAGNLSAEAVVLDELPACAPAPDAGALESPAPDAAAPAPDAIAPASLDAEEEPGCSVGAGATGSSLLPLALLFFGRHARRRGARRDRGDRP